MLSLLIQGWTIGAAGRFLRIGQPRPDVNAHRTELDLPGTLKQELVGYPVVADSPYLRRGIAPTWAKLTLVVRDERVLTPEEAAPVREGDQVYFLAPPDRVQALDRFFAERTSARPDAALVEDFFVPGDVTHGRARRDLRPHRGAGGCRRRRSRITSPPISSSIRRGRTT